MEVNNPSILALMETKMDDHDKILQAFDYMNIQHVPDVVYSRGITLLWDITEATIGPFVITDEEIDTNTEASSTPPKLFFSIVYAK